MRTLLLALLLPLSAVSQDTIRPQDAKTRMEEQARINREIERERNLWRIELRRHEEDCRRERDRINREHQIRIDEVQRRARRR